MPDIKHVISYLNLFWRFFKSHPSEMVKKYKKNTLKCAYFNMLIIFVALHVRYRSDYCVFGG
jgi:hypothetical protein